MLIRKLRDYYLRNSKRKFCVYLPPPRYRMGGQNFNTNERFLRGALTDVIKLVNYCGLDSGNKVYDFGCAAGRLAIALKVFFGDSIEYIGTDVQADHISWAQKNIASKNFSFFRIDAKNSRYNDSGQISRTLQVNDASVDVFYAYSVFSHFTPEEAEDYLALIEKSLALEGVAFITAFVEENVPRWEENPNGYTDLEMKGPLHCARFEKSYFESLIEKPGLVIRNFFYGNETDGQSAYVIVKKSSSALSGDTQPVKPARTIF